MIGAYFLSADCHCQCVCTASNNSSYQGTREYRANWIAMSVGVCSDKRATKDMSVLAHLSSGIPRRACSSLP